MTGHEGITPLCHWAYGLVFLKAAAKAAKAVSETKVRWWG
jgi:hypothetical protein